MSYFPTISTSICYLNYTAWNGHEISIGTVRSSILHIARFPNCHECPVASGLGNLTTLHPTPNQSIQSVHSLGATVFSKIDVFFKKSKRPWNPPPLSLFGNFIALFSRKLVSMRKFAMNFFGLAMTPPLSPPFWTFFPKFTTKIYRFETNKICNVIFWIGNDPPPLLDLFQKNIHIWGDGHPQWVCTRDRGEVLVHTEQPQDSTRLHCRVRKPVKCKSNYKKPWGQRQELLCLWIHI